MPEKGARRRVVIFGASNIARNLPTVVATAQQTWGQPLDIFAAYGHGRSYGMTSCVLGRTLPAILRCGIWEELDRQPPANTAVLLTDVGNDILYGAGADLIATWVERCLQRLVSTADEITMTELPLASVRTLEPLRFFVARTLLFPRSRLTLPDALETAKRLNDAIIALADRYGATLVQPLSHWYTVDPIHIRYRHRASAWRTILSSWYCDETPLKQLPMPIPQTWRIGRLRPAQRHLFGIEQRRQQPARTLADGTTISFY